MSVDEQFILDFLMQKFPEKFPSPADNYSITDLYIRTCNSIIDIDVKAERYDHASQQMFESIVFFAVKYDEFKDFLQNRSEQTDIVKCPVTGEELEPKSMISKKNWVDFTKIKIF